MKYLKVKFFRAYWRTKVYKRHRAKMVKDAYTSQMVKVQALLFYLLFPLAAASFFSQAFYLLLGLDFLLLVLTTLPFAAWAFSRDKTVGLVAPVTILLRTIAFGFGLLAGTARELFEK